MMKLDERTIANLDVVLEQVCRALPNGGDHKTRKCIAQKLIQNAKKGNKTLSELKVVAERALSDLIVRSKSA